VFQEKLIIVSLITNLIDKITELVKLKLDQVKIEVKGQVAVLISKLVVLLIIALLLSFMLLFFGLGLAFFLNTLFASSYWGFFFVGALALLAAIFLIYKARSESFADMIKSRLLDNEE